MPSKKALAAVSLVLWTVVQVTSSSPVTGDGSPAVAPPVQSDPHDSQETEALQLLEGDILASPQLVHELYNTEGESKNEDLSLDRLSRAVFSSNELIWSEGVIPYIVNACIDAQLRASILFAMGRWENSTCLKFVKRSGQEDYVEFTCSSKAALCSSYVGRVGGRQTIQLGRDCDDRVLHEIGHTVGLWHEHSRPDRDCFVEIIRDNVDSSHDYDFPKLRRFDAQYTTTYDYGSVMHYRMDEFGNETSPGYRLQTMRVKNTKQYDSQGRPTIGKMTRLSANDILQTNRLYQWGVGVASLLKVHVKSGSISGNGTPTDFSSTADPYVRIRAYDNKGNGVTKVTRTVINTLSPTWNQWLEFGKGLWMYMDVEVLEDDSGVDYSMTSLQTFPVEEGKHKDLKHYELSLETCRLSSYVDFDYHAILLSADVICTPNPCLNGGSCSYIRQTLDFNCACAQSWAGKKCQYRRGRLQVYALRGYNMPDKDCCNNNYGYLTRYSDPYMQVNAISHSGNNETKKSSIVSDNQSPTWSTWLDFGFDTWYNFTVSVWDYDSATSSDILTIPTSVTPVYGSYVTNQKTCASTTSCGSSYAYFYYRFQAT